MTLVGKSGCLERKTNETRAPDELPITYAGESGEEDVTCLRTAATSSASVLMRSA